MSGLSRRIKQLDEELLALGEDSMLLEELDGFIAGLLICPELIRPSDWLPVVWHEDTADQAPVFENLDHANRVLRLVMEHYNDLAYSATIWVGSARQSGWRVGVAAR